MSLITQMLNDLDKRGANQATNIDPLATAVRTAMVKESSSLGPAIIAAAVILVLGIGGIVWMQGSKPGTPAPATNTALMVAAAPTASAQATAPATATAAPPAIMPPAAQAVPAGAALVTAAANPAAPTATTGTPTPAPEAAPARAETPPPAPSAKVAAVKPPPVVAVAPPAPPVPPVAVETKKPAAPAPAEQTRPVPAPALAKAASAKETVPTVEPVKTQAKAKPDPAATSAADTKSPSPVAMKTTRPDQRAENLYKQGVTQLMQGRPHEAIEALNQALAINPAHHDARILQSSAYVDLSRADKAVSVLEAGIAAYPEYLPYSMNLVRVQLGRKQTDAAIAVANRALPVAGDDAEFHALLGALLQQKGKHTEAAEHYLTALRSDPMQANWLVGAAISLQSTGRHSDAAKAYQRALETGDLSPAVTEFALQNLAKLR